jgi:hypothetical protein
MGMYSAVVRLGLEPILCVEQRLGRGADRDVVEALPDHCQIFRGSMRMPVNGYEQETYSNQQLMSIPPFAAVRP